MLVELGRVHGQVKARYILRAGSRVHRAQAPLFNEGDVGDRFYIILIGEIEVALYSPASMLP
jgi:hypothetical protein